MKQDSIEFLITEDLPTACDENKFYVYLHKRKSDGSVFYVGKGHGPRFKSKSGRSKHWINIAKKNGVIVEFFAFNISESEAFEIEIDLIKRLRERGENICNIYDGGEGPSGFKHTKETKMKFRMAKLGKPQMPSHAAKSRTARLGQKNTPEMIAITKKARSKRIIRSDGVCFKSVSDAVEFMENCGEKAYQGVISGCARGERNNACGYSWSYDTSKTPTFRETKYNTKKVKCVETGIVFESVTNAQKFLSNKLSRPVAHQCISKAARKNGKSYGLRWSYI